MRLLADENCDPVLIETLRDAGHDVLAIGEEDRGASDEAVIERALEEDRLLLTLDKDFGDLVYNHSRRSRGVVLVRGFADLPLRVQADAIQTQGTTMLGRFVVVEPNRVRIGGRVPST